MSLPVVDMSAVSAARSEVDGGHAAVARQIGAACSDLGFFYITGHGVDPDLIERVVAGSTAFFALPEASKQAIAMEKSGRHWKGWFRLGGELTSGQPDHKEGLYLGDELGMDHPEVRKGTLMHGPNLWPEVPGFPTFKHDVLQYLDELERVAHLVLAAIATSLGLPQNHFDATFRPSPTRLLRLFQYPTPTDSETRGRWGVGEHCDYGVLTILLQDDVGGLEVRARNGEWLSAKPIPNSFVVNIGDMLERLSWGRYRATPHRVRNSSDHRDRLSIPFFFDPCWDAIVEPIRELGGAPSDASPTPGDRWDGQDVVIGPPRAYGDILTDRVAKVFPALFQESARL
eukprot:m.104000 g.104000  ORF g.104000 m.104000 type:complete len:343 (+) comp20901_c0_seq2:52-1080(+)